MLLAFHVLSMSPFNYLITKKLKKNVFSFKSVNRFHSYYEITVFPLIKQGLNILQKRDFKRRGASVEKK